MTYPVKISISRFFVAKESQRMVGIILRKQSIAVRMSIDLCFWVLIIQKNIYVSNEVGIKNT